MEMPEALREAIAKELDTARVSGLRREGNELSRRYRSETVANLPHLEAAGRAEAYIATRMPATYAAIRAAMAHVATAAPDFAPRSQLDAGAGPGTAMWAAGNTWPSIERADLLEASPRITRMGQTLAESQRDVDARWHTADLVALAGRAGRNRDPAQADPLTKQADPFTTQADLVTLAYVLDELPQEAWMPLADWLWRATGQVLVVVEPGTSNGWRRILQIRARLLAAGAHILAPCPHTLECPLHAPDWCHFSQRLARSRIHRAAKDADLAWEDEKYAYIAFGRQPADQPSPARVLTRPHRASGRVHLRLCTAEGRAVETVVSKRQKDSYGAARRLEWGDAFAGHPATAQPGASVPGAEPSASPSSATPPTSTEDE